MIRIRPAPKVMFPSQSMGARLWMPVSSSFMYAQTVPKRPIGTEMRKTSRQLTGASRPPSTSPTNMPATATTLLSPSAIPRWCDGNASVRIAAEFPSRNAAPTPWTMRHAISQSAPDVPVSQSTARSSDAPV